MMCPSRNRGFLLVGLGLLLATASCQKENPLDKREPLTQEDLGLKVIRSGDKPASAPGPKGTMVELGTTEVKLILVRPGGPADEAGFQAGDILLSANEKDINSEDDLALILKEAAGKKIFFEVKRGRQLLTLSMANVDPAWFVLSGDTFKGFLLTRLQADRTVATLPVGHHAPNLRLPTLAGERFDLAALKGHPVALLFWGTFSEPCYAHLQALQKTCVRLGGEDLKCIAVDTMELFTAVGKTAEYQSELLRVRKEFWPSYPVPIDLFMESEAGLGVKKLPTLILLDAQGTITQRFDGPLADPFNGIEQAIAALVPASPRPSD